MPSEQPLDKARVVDADRLGRRLYTALVSSSLVLSSAWLISTHHDIVGGIMLGLAVMIVVGHLLLDASRAWRKKT